MPGNPSDSGMFPSTNGSITPAERFKTIEGDIDNLYGMFREITKSITDVKISVVKITSIIMGISIAANIGISLLSLWLKFK